MIEYLETGDIGRTLDRTGATIRWYIRQGRLRPTARTLRGTQLFTLEDVEDLRRQLRIPRKKDPAVSAR
jgi:DNA-binding transcriptional MerR regulator